MSYPDETPELPREERSTAGRRTGWHRVNTGHLVMGVAFTGLLIVWALVVSDTVQVEEDGWIMGLPWLAAGAAGLIASVLRGRRPDETWEQAGWEGQQARDWQ
ncbi:hypothetical protein [Nocardioides daeguensis]|uniref:DUF2530 domain-containing protein n=1 Tax=Nocardioides daeguensis TaxID=908359 RepID=A0ABP6W2C6_9ACTN|nr:hypothetical protein [Nocardioides daeguensis]MBV6727701.1 hypothetical protein [Nocardioides daeguensis]MCR1775173.1 hypothetical protein [Nocardioides daeguensis]